MRQLRRISFASLAIHRAKVAVLLALVLFVVPAASSGSKPLVLTTRADGTVAGVGGRYALVVGVNDYSKAGLGSLQYCERDAQALRDNLVDHGGFPAENVTLWLGPQATQAAVLHYMANLAQPSLFPQADTFVFYFSGHGGVIRSPGEGPNSQESRDQYLIPANGTSDAVMSKYNNVPLAEVMRALDGCPFPRKVLLLDACRVVLTTNGSKGTAFSAFDLTPYATARGVKGMAATLPGYYSWEDERLGDDQLGYGHGVFTYYLLRGLRGEAADSNGVVTFNGLDGYLSKEMAEYSRTHVDKAQTPQPFGEGNGGIALALAVHPAAPVSAPPAPVQRLATSDPAYSVMQYLMDRGALNPARFFSANPPRTPDTVKAIGLLQKAAIISSQDLDHATDGGWGTPSSAHGGAAYDDVPTSHWAYPALDYLAERGVMEGEPDGFFHGEMVADRSFFLLSIARCLDGMAAPDGKPHGRGRLSSDELADLPAAMCEIFPFRRWTRFEMAIMFARLLDATQLSE